MDIENSLLVIGVFLIIVSAVVMVFSPDEVITDPEPRFGVEVSSFVNGDAEFVYRPVQNESFDTYISYNITVNNETVDSIDNRRVNGLSSNQPFKVTVEAEPRDQVTVDIKITNLEGKILHDTHHTISGEE